MLGSAVPMVAVALATSSFVANIHIHLPPFARRSQAALHRFVQRLPPETIVEMTAMRFNPLQKTRFMRFGELRVLEPNYIRLANIERVPTAHAGKEVPRWMRAFLGQFYVRPGDRYTKKSRAPGAWQTILDQIVRNTHGGGLKATRTTKTYAMPAPARVMPRSVTAGKIKK